MATFRISEHSGQYFDTHSLLRPVSQGQSELAMSEGLGGVRSEGKLGAEHSLALQTSALTDEQMVVVALEKRRKM